MIDFDEETLARLEADTEANRPALQAHDAAVNAFVQSQMDAMAGVQEPHREPTGMSGLPVDQMAASAFIQGGVKAMLDAIHRATPGASGSDVRQNVETCVHIAVAWVLAEDARERP